MTGEVLDRTPARVAAGAPQRAGAALGGLLVRQTRRGTALVVLVAAGMSAVVAAQYQSTFAGALDGPALQALAANPAVRALFGPPVALDDAGGFTVWRTGTPVGVLIGTWALLVATRITRGEEDAGRWDLLLAGRVRKADLLGAGLVVLGGGVLLVGGGVLVALLASGTAPTGALLHAAGMAGVGLGFAAVGALAAQMMPTRAAATGLSVAVLGATLLMRMLADGFESLAWMGWVSPFGLLSEISPYAQNRPGPLLVLAAVPPAIAAVALLAARRRDVGAGLVRVPASRRPRLRLLGSTAGFAVRTAIRPLLGWAVGLASYFLFIGLLAVSATQFLAENAQFAELAADAGFGGLGSVRGFASALFALLGIPVGLCAAGRIAAVAADETARRSVLLFGLPLSRSRILTAETAVAVAGAVLLLVVAGLAMWLGTALAGTSLGVGPALAGALNATPIVVLCVGAAVLALGLAPRAVLAVGSLPAVGGFLLQVVAESTGAPAWVGDLSPFAHVAQVPFAAPDWTGAVVLTGLAAVLAAVGYVGYARRDLAV